MCARWRLPKLRVRLPKPCARRRRKPAIEDVPYLMTERFETQTDAAIHLDGSPGPLSRSDDEVIVAETKTKKSPRSAPAPQPRLADVWRVVVLNDPVNRMSYVVMVLRRVFGFTEERARKHMLEVHEQGRSVIWSGTREQAEAYVFALQQWHLPAVVQPADA